MGGTRKASILWPFASALVFSGCLGACSGFWQQRASCEQMVLAFCEMSEHCGGEGAGTCRSARSKLLTSCSTSVDDASICVESINDALAEDCAAVPADIACPAEVITAPTSGSEGEGEGDTVYRLCSGDPSVCGDLPDCGAPGNRESAMCTKTCTQASDCPDPSNGFAALCVPLSNLGDVCVAGCRLDTDCAEGMACVDGANCIPAQ